jgi:alpha-L-rhamnosidase
MPFLLVAVQPCSNRRGFRYVQLTGYPGTPDFQTLTAHFVHTDVEMIGSVAFSDPNLNGVQHITRMASLSNFQSIPTDCPQRERFGWLGDAQLSCETTMHNFDM